VRRGYDARVPRPAAPPVAPRPVDARIPVAIRQALVEVSGCDDVALRLETRLRDLPLTTWDCPWGCSEDLVELVITLEEAYGISLEDQQDVIDATWPGGTVQTVLETLHRAGVAL
jgi:hypothetical protein